MDNYKPKFSKTSRNGKTALWVELPDGDKWSIWDLKPKECTSEVWEAIQSAFERGMKAKTMQVQRVL